MRLAQTQVCPALRYFDAIAPATASSRSASSNTMNGALPPSSRLTFFTVSEHWRIRSLPTCVEPVNDNLRTIGLDVSSLPISAPWDAVTTLITPSGKPARRASSTSANAVSGVSSAGLITTVQPAASAGAHLRVIIAIGKFHGVMAATTPIGCLMVMMRLSAPCDGMTSP